MAIATFETILKWIKQTDIINFQRFLTELKHNLITLAFARPNEPLAVNGVRYVLYNLSIHQTELESEKIFKIRKLVEESAQEFLDIISRSKSEIKKWGTPFIAPYKIIFTHCHSSTVESIIIKSDQINKKTIIATETRPLYQGRITARNLIKNGVDTIMIVDSAAARFIADDSILPVDVVLIGADEILPTGDAINKVGSFGIALSANVYNKPTYIVTPSLKLNMYTDPTQTRIEIRSPEEIWKTAPKGLKIINPAFELIPKKFITGFITEFGILEPHELKATVKKHYPWVTYQLEQ